MAHDEVYDALKEIMGPFGEKLVCKTDEPGNYYLETEHIAKNKKPLFFGAITTRKHYVSYHLMPIYLNPALLDSLSPKLKKRMQGKSCFNFKSVDDELFGELQHLTEASFKDFESQGFISSEET